MQLSEFFNEAFADDFLKDETEILPFLETIKEMEQICLKNPINYTLFSGGAEGSDLYWQRIGAKFGMKVKAFSFEAHNTRNSNARVVLSLEQLKKADEFLHNANRTLKRHFPTGKSFVNNLLRRNWYQVKDTRAVFAVGRVNFSRSIVEGGTGWAVQMAIDSKKIVYVFDIASSTPSWQQFDYGKRYFLPCIKLPTLTLNFTAIGTRLLPECGKQAIDKIFENTFGKL